MGANALRCIPLLLVLFNLAHATTLTFAFSGNVTQVPVDEIFGDIAVGDPIRGSYTFDTSAIDQAPDNSSTGSFSWTEPFGLSVLIGAHTFMTTGTLHIGVLNSFVDQYSVLGRSAANDVTVGLLLQDSTGAAFTNDQLPVSPPSIVHFLLRDFRLDALIADRQVQIDGQLDTLSVQAVPEPSPGLLVLVGALLFGVARVRTPRSF